MLGAGIPPVFPPLPSVSNPDASGAAHWPMLLLLAFAIGVVLGAWLGSRISSSPSDGRSGWGGRGGGPPRGSPERPGPIGGEGEPSWISEIERFLAEQRPLAIDRAGRRRSRSKGNRETSYFDAVESGAGRGAALASTCGEAQSNQKGEGDATIEVFLGSDARCRDRFQRIL